MRKNLILLLALTYSSIYTYAQSTASPNTKVPSTTTALVNSPRTAGKTSGPSPKTRHLEMMGLQNRIRAYTIEAIALYLNSNTYQRMGVRDCSQQKSFELLNDKLTFVEQMVGTWKSYKSFKMSRKLEDFRDKMIKMCCGSKSDKPGAVESILEKTGLVNSEKHQKHQKRNKERNRSGADSVPIPNDSDFNE